VDRPQWAYRRLTDGKTVLTKPFRHRPANIKLHYRMLDFDEDPDDIDGFFKMELELQGGGEYVDPVTLANQRRMQRAKVVARKVLEEIDTYRWLTAARRRLQRAAFDLDFVFEPYRQQIKKLGKKKVDELIEAANEKVRAAKQARYEAHRARQAKLHAERERTRALDLGPAPTYEQVMQRDAPIVRPVVSEPTAYTQHIESELLWRAKQAERIRRQVELNKPELQVRVTAPIEQPDAAEITRRTHAMAELQRLGLRSPYVADPRRRVEFTPDLMAYLERRACDQALSKSVKRMIADAWVGAILPWVYVSFAMNKPLLFRWTQWAREIAAELDDPD